MAERLRVLVLITDHRWSASALALGMAAQSLAVRGHVVAIGCVAGGPVARAIRERWPRLSVRDVRGDGWWRRASTVRDVVQALRPDAMLVGNDDDAAAAALAMGSRGGVVHRIPLPPDLRPTVDGHADTDVKAQGWRHRTALSRSHVVSWGPAVETVIWPAIAAENATDVESDPPPRLPLAIPHVVLTVPPVHDSPTASALRALGTLHERHPELRVTLVAESVEPLVVPTIQDTRVHAAAVGLAHALDVLSLDQWMDGLGGAATACWIVDGGDAGAFAALAAMHRGIPVIVAAESPLASLVVPLATGLHAPAVLSDLARLIGDVSWHATMSRAAQLRARRHFSSEGMLNELEARLARVASPNSRSSSTASV
ncbi:MAG: glycosyltransferase [Gemmatimonadaceae bacterium]|nr:glycosyltransferase [Gemmatimonadaceae bacterium]